MTFAEKLQQLRERAGLSQSQLARASGVSVWTLRGYEQGRREPLWDVLFKLAKGLGVDCQAFAEAAEARSAARNKPRGRSPKTTPATPSVAGLEASAKKPRRPRRQK